MKINQHIFALALFTGAMMGLTSCGDKFLEEDLITQKSTCHRRLPET